MLRILQQVRFSSIKHATKAPLKYTNTINLPKTKFPIRLSTAKRAEVERLLLEETLSAAYLHQELHNEQPTFVLHDGPPYANGDLHMGHAVNKILKDITLRQHAVRGRKVHYVPGWDCHGLPIELKAMGSSPKSASKADPLEIRKKSRRFAVDAIERQRAEFRAWGIMADWNNPRRIYLTFQPDFIINQLQMFSDFYKRGLVYRDLKPVYWSPSSRTALAEAELEYDPNFVSPSVYVRFALNKCPSSFSKQISGKLYALVWTTTPWTLPSNQAICYNDTLEYAFVRLQHATSDENALYLIATNLLQDFEEKTVIKCDVVHRVHGTDLLSCTYQHPIDCTQLALPFFPAAHVQDTKGTGLVHTAPAHGPDDFLISLQQQLSVKAFVNEDGIYTNDAPEFLRGKAVIEEGDNLVLQHLGENVIHSGTLQHAYPIDWRTKKPVIIRASEQWFMNTDSLKERAVEAIAGVEIYPRVNAESSKKALVTQVQKRPYWCISRQRAWGVPIPVFYSRHSGKVITNDDLIAHICDMVKREGNIDFWWSKSIKELLPINSQVSPDEVIKGEDIFDIWFDSGSTWSTVLKDNCTADLYLEGYDQFTGWFQSSLLTSIAARNCSPYKALFVHGFTVDEKGHKMSKSLGNVISPKDITKKYGVDVLRWWVAAHGAQNMSITVSDRLLQQAQENISKIRATLRYLNGAIGEKTDSKAPADARSYLNKYLLSQLVDFEREVNKSYDCYEFNRAVANVQNFVANQISALYVHLVKDRLYCGRASDVADIRFTLSQCYEVLCKMLWPIAPFLVEESWRYYAPGTAFHQQTVRTNATWQDPHAEAVVNTALDAKRLLNRQISDTNSWNLAVTIQSACPETLELLQRLQPPNVACVDTELCEILQVGQVTLLSTHARAVEGADKLLVDIQVMEANLCPRCRRFSVKESEITCPRCTDVLSASH